MDITKQQFLDMIYYEHPHLKNVWNTNHGPMIPRLIDEIATLHLMGDVYGNQSYQKMIEQVRLAAIELHKEGLISFKPEK